MPLSTLTGQLDGIDAGRLTDLFHHIGNVLVRIDNAHPITVFSPLVRLRNRAMADVRRIDDPAFNKNYGA